MKTGKIFDPGYCVCERVFSKKTSKHYEGAFTQGSGYLHIRGSFEEGLGDADQNEEYMRLPANVTIEKPRHPVSKWGTYIPGITGIHPLLKEEIVNLPYMLLFKVSANGKSLDMANSDISNYQRRLDMRDGLLYREFDWNVDEDTKIKCFYSRFISGVRKNLVIQDMNFTVLKGKCRLNFISGIDERVKTNGYNHFNFLSKKTEKGDCLLKLITDNNDTVLMESRTFSDEIDFKENNNQLEASALLTQSEIIHVKKLSVTASSKDANNCLNFDNLKEQLDNAQKDLGLIYQEHESYWSELWEKSRVEIEGDAKSQLAVNFSIYHLLRAANPQNNNVAICAKGFAGEAYFGHFFWDTEIFMMPFFVHTRPAAAEALAQFRINTLEGAKRNARQYGYKGAKYPWESSISGDEQCPNWHYADFEVHINADVVFGLWNYYCATNDEAFLLKAAPVFVETSRYWLSRVEHKPDGSVNLNGVMGPDEYTLFCNNNAYTNSMVSWSLKRTLDVIKHVKDTDRDVYHSLKLTSEELRGFKEVLEKLPVKITEDNVILQCDGFADFEEPDFKKVWFDRSKPFGNFISQERNYRTKALKQADALMLPYLFPGFMNREQLESNYNFYYPYTTHDSSLSRIIHSILCSRMGRTTEAYELFMQSLDIDLSEEKSGAAEGIHIANCGGIWQAIVFGFAGMLPCYESESLQFVPKLPPAWKTLKFNIEYRGTKYTVQITKEKVTLIRRES